MILFQNYTKYTSHLIKPILILRISTREIEIEKNYKQRKRGYFYKNYDK